MKKYLMFLLIALYGAVPVTAQQSASGIVELLCKYTWWSENEQSVNMMSFNNYRVSMKDPLSGFSGDYT